MRHKPYEVTDMEPSLPNIERKLANKRANSEFHTSFEELDPVRATIKYNSYEKGLARVALVSFNPYFYPGQLYPFALEGTAREDEQTDVETGSSQQDKGGGSIYWHEGKLYLTF